MQLNGMGDTSWSDVLNNVVSQLPNIASGVATYELTSQKIKAGATPTAVSPALNYSPYIPTSYTAQNSPVYSTQPAAAPAANNTLLYVAIGGAALLLILALTSKG